MIRAVIRPDREEQVVQALESSGIVSLTKVDVFGRGQQRGVQVGNRIYSELPKVMLTIVVEETKLGRSRRGHSNRRKNRSAWRR